MLAGPLTAHESTVRFFMDESIPGNRFSNWRAMLLRGRYPHSCGRDEARPSSVKHIVEVFLSNENSAVGVFQLWRAMLPRGRYPHTCGRDEART